MEVKRTGKKEKLLIPEDFGLIVDFINKNAEDLILEISNEYKKKISKKIMLECLDKFKENYIIDLEPLDNSTTKNQCDTTNKPIKETKDKEIKEKNWKESESKDELNKYTVPNLKAFCLEVGLPQTGLKAALVEKLWNYIQLL